MQKDLIIGKILKPHGIKGEVKVQLLADDFDSVKKIRNVKIDGEEYKIMSSRFACGDWYISLRGVADRNAAELLRQKEIFADRDDIAKPADSYFIEDVLGCSLVLDAGDEIGKITDIVCSNVDIYYVSLTGGGTCVFPMLKDLIVSFDIENNKVVVKKSRFDEVVLYEKGGAL